MSVGRADPAPAGGQRWLARAAFAALLASLVVLIASEGAIGLTLLGVGVVGSVAILSGGFWFIAKRDIRRWIGLAMVAIAAVLVVFTFFRANVILVALTSLALLALGGVAARHALRNTPEPWMPVAATPPPHKAFIVMNPRSGGGKVVRFDLAAKARALGAEVVLLDGPGYVDVAAIVREAVHGGADLLGVAGGDGTQALVAGIAADHDIPLLVISAGTRNHFALDLGLNRDDPSTCLQALTDGEEVRVDLGMIADRPFVNNASFGAYAEIVQSPEYRDNKNRTMLEMLPDLLSGHGGANLTVRTGARTLTGLQAVLVSNNPYSSSRVRDMGRRTRLDQGTLGILAGQLSSATQAVGLLRRRQYRSITSTTGDGQVIVDAETPTIPVGIDGEAVTVSTPVHARSGPVRCGCYCPGIGPAYHRHDRRSTGNDCGRSRSGIDAATTAPSRTREQGDRHRIDRVDPDERTQSTGPAGPVDRVLGMWRVMDRSEIVARGSQVGLVVASATVPATFARSLSDRTWMDQGVITGMSTITQYAVSVVAQDGIDIGGAVLAKVLPFPESWTAEQRRRVAILLLDIAVVPVGFGLAALFRFRDNDNQLRALARQIGLRLGVTGTGGTLLTGALAATRALDDRVQAGGRLARFPVGLPVGLVVAFVVERLRQRDDPPEHAADPASASPLAGLAAGMGIVLALAGGAAAEGSIARVLGAIGGRVLPGSEDFWRRATHASLLSAVGFGTHVVWGRAMRGIEAGTTKYDGAIGASAAGVWTSPMVSGDPASLVRWDTIGREGRRHAIAYVRPEPPIDRPAQIGGRTRPDLSISTVMQENAKASPIQVFVGLDSAPTPADRVELAMAELDRTEAWKRSVLLLISPTGTGYVNYVATACVQYLTRGDVASVTLQYSKRPSPLSLGKVHAAGVQNRLLWLRIFERVRAMPPEDRPKVVLFGESLGALTSQNVLIGWGTLGLQALGIDRALWVGTPEGSRWMHEVTGEPRPDVDKSLVAMVNDYEQFCELGDEPKERVRYVLLSHDNDGVTKFGPSLINRRPGWLGPSRPANQELPGRSPRGTPSSMHWRLVTTFYQSLIDMKNAQTPGAYRAWAHDYRPDLADFIHDVFDLDCTPEQLERIRAACQAREEFREAIFR